MSTAVAVRTLWDLEESLAALLNTEDVVPAELEAEFKEQLALALSRTVEKRDRCFQFVRHCQTMQMAADDEIERLKERKAMFAKAEDRMRGYLTWILENLGTDSKGRYQKLEGQTVTLGLKACPAAVDIRNEEIVPDEFKRVTVQMPAELWAEVVGAAMDCQGIDLRLHTFLAANPLKVQTLKTPIKAAIEAGRDVPGADLKIGGVSLTGLPKLKRAAAVEEDV